MFRTSHPSLGFRYYEPSYLPVGTSIKAKRISISPGYKDAELNFRTEDWVYEIQESKALHEDTIGMTDRDYDVTSVKLHVVF